LGKIEYRKKRVTEERVNSKRKANRRIQAPPSTLRAAEKGRVRNGEFRNESGSSLATPPFYWKSSRAGELPEKKATE